MGIPEHWKCVKMHKFYRKLNQQPKPLGKHKFVTRKYRCRAIVYIYKIQKDALYKDCVSKYYSRYGKYDD